MKKKDKEKKKIEGKKWGAGKTVLSVFAGVAGVTGATIFGVYLAGGFNERIIEPEKIDFDIDDIDYDNANFSYNTEFEQIETCEDFEILLSASNKNVTKDKVTLSFDAQI